MYYLSVYNNLCSSKCQLKEHWGKNSGLHRHHIIPRHTGGKDEDTNYTYLSPKEHIIAHFLLWKIYKNPNDLRSMKMLGAKLSYEQRRIVGVFCRDNNIGFHGASKEERTIWQRKGLESQQLSGSNNSFYYWSTPEGRKERAQLGGRASFVSENNPNFLYWASPEGRKERARLGGKAHKGKICVTNGAHRTRIKPELLEEYLSKGYKEGFTLFS